MIPKYIAHKRANAAACQSLTDHLQGVARESKKFAHKINTPLAGELIGLLHDIGKYSQAFQDYIKSATGIFNQDEDENYVDSKTLKGKIDHSSAGAQFIWQTLSEKENETRIVAKILALCIASHHSGLIDCLAPDEENKFLERMNKCDKKTHLQEIKGKAESIIIARVNQLLQNPELINEVKKEIKGTIKSSEHKIPAYFKLGLLVRFIFSCLIDADRIDTANFENPKSVSLRQSGKYKSWQILIDRLETHLKTFKTVNKIDELRKNIAQHCLDRANDTTGFFTLTVPTGGGKTLSSLRFALHHAKKHKMDRIIYVLPYTSIIDQNADVVRRILEIEEENGNIVLEHHSNLTPEKQTFQTKVLSENWDAPIVYTTSIQLLETLFGAGTRGARRMHQLSKAVIIFDEIQTLPIRCIHMFCNAMNYLVERCQSTIVLCTATQPLLHKVDSTKGCLPIDDNNEIMPNVAQLFLDLKRVEIINKEKQNGWQDEEIAQLAKSILEDNINCLIIVNTKTTAKEIYEKCITMITHKVYHLSTSMCSKHRLTILREIKHNLENRQKFICISTQLIEAGVDVDFDVVIRSLAGLDSIAQAAGRCNRHGKKDISKVYVINAASEKTDKLYDIKEGKEKAARIFREFEKKDLLSPAAMNQYFQYYFYDRAEEMSYSVSSSKIGRDDTLLDLLSSNSKTKNNRMDPLLNHAFSTAANAFEAIDSPTRGVIVPYGEEGKQLIASLCGAYELEKQSVLLKKAQPYTVGIFPHEWKKLENEKAIYQVQDNIDIYYLDERFYEENYGLSTNVIDTLEIKIC